MDKCDFCKLWKGECQAYHYNDVYADDCCDEAAKRYLRYLQSRNSNNRTKNVNINKNTKVTNNNNKNKKGKR